MCNVVPLVTPSIAVLLIHVFIPEDLSSDLRNKKAPLRELLGGFETPLNIR